MKPIDAICFAADIADFQWSRLRRGRMRTLLCLMASLVITAPVMATVDWTGVNHVTKKLTSFREETFIRYPLFWEPLQNDEVEVPRLKASGYTYTKHPWLLDCAVLGAALLGVVLAVACWRRRGRSRG